MPNSGTVTAGSAALASQYNNLRADVLDVATGHTHAGTTGEGAKVHGTALSSTGATNGQVLTADGSGGAAFTTLAQSGALATIAATVIFPASTASGTSVPSATYVRGTTDIAQWAASGTVLFSASVSISTGPNKIMYHNLSASSVTVNPSATASPALTTAGTAIYINLSAKGFSTADGVVFFEGVRATTSGSVSGTLRRYTNTLGTNSWNATIYAQATVATNDWSQWQMRAFSSRRATWASEVNSWLSADCRTSAGSSFVYAVNDTSGSVYTATWGTYVANGSAPARMDWLAWVPGTAANTGTAHLFCVQGNGSAVYTGGAYPLSTFKKIAYSVGTAGITAESTASGSAGYPTLNIADTALQPLSNNYEYPFDGYWDSDLEQYVLFVRQASGTSLPQYAVGYDRTMGTVLWRSLLNSPGYNSATYNSYNAATRWDQSQRIYMNGVTNSAYAFVHGSAGPLYSARRAIWQQTSWGTAASTATTPSDPVVGNGSAEYALEVVGNGTQAYTYRNVDVWKSVTVEASTKARIVSLTGAQGRNIATIAGASAYPMQWRFGEQFETNTGTYTMQRTAPSFPLVLPANQSLRFVVNGTNDLSSNPTLYTGLERLSPGTVVLTLETIDLA